MARRSRRQFVQGVGSMGLALVAGCALPLSAPPQATQVHRIARLAGSPPDSTTTVLVSALREGLQDLGYVEGQNLLIDERYANGDDQVAEPAAELVRLQTEVIVVPGAPVARAVLAVSGTIPIVSAGSGDLVAGGLAASHARPGGTVTGLSTPLLAGKQLQFLQEVVPRLSRVAVLFDKPLDSLQPVPRALYEAAARPLGLQLLFVGTGDAEDLESVFDAAAREHVDGLIVLQGAVISGSLMRISELAVERLLPSIWQYSDAVRRGGLVSYAPNRIAMNRRAASYVDKILKGSRPADLPIEEPSTFDILLNLKTAQALGLTIPQSVLLQATELIQ